MHKFLSALLILHLAFFSNAQTPGGINYQGVARNQYQTGLNNDSIQLRFTIKKTSANGPIVYTETRGTRTDSFGVFNVVIGSVGAISKSGDIKGLPWSEAAGKFLMVELNINPGFDLDWLYMGTNQLLSVPFSFYSDVSDSTRIAGKAENAALAAKADSATFSNASGRYFFSATIDLLGTQVVPRSQEEDEQGNLVYKDRLQFPVVGINEGNHYNPATSEFTAPEAGIYQFDVLLNDWMITTQSYLDIQMDIGLMKNGKLIKTLAKRYKPEFKNDEIQGHVRLLLNTGDKVAVYIANGSENDDISINIGGTQFVPYFTAKNEMISLAEFSGYKIK